MTEQDSPVPTDSPDGLGADASNATPPPSFGDPSLELFGHGWSPKHETATNDGSYTGRHRAPDV